MLEATVEPAIKTSHSQTKPPRPTESLAEETAKTRRALAESILAETDLFTDTNGDLQKLAVIDVGNKEVRVLRLHLDDRNWRQYEGNTLKEVFSEGRLEGYELPAYEIFHFPGYQCDNPRQFLEKVKKTMQEKGLEGFYREYEGHILSKSNKNYR